ncbi:hypothetical protein [Pseudonocardia yunnanensis]|uniref:hypothetical protein n=1 Tax=Pseudonocardia yunnanensis TaxID=58107 RepID=UPI0031CF6BCE
MTRGARRSCCHTAVFGLAGAPPRGAPLHRGLASLRVGRVGRVLVRRALGQG